MMKSYLISALTVLSLFSCIGIAAEKKSAKEAFVQSKKDTTAAANSQRKNTRVVMYPASDKARTSDHYRVSVNGRSVDVYAMNTDTRNGKYYFTCFDFSGSVTVKVTSKQDLSRTVLRPLSYGIKPETKEKSLTFHLDCPQKISIEPDGPNSALLLFANPLEKAPPSRDDPNVIYYGPGFHDAGKIRLKSNQTLYLAGGAMVQGGIIAQGKNIQIRGRGILYGGGYAKLKGPFKGWGGGYMIHINKCSDVTVRDIILCDAWHWTLVPRFSNNIVIENVKICNSRFYNEDGIDPVNCRDLLIRDCFIRTKDDCIAIKGHKRTLTCERIRIENCVFWSDGANPFRLGYESEVKGLMCRDLTAKNIDIIHIADKLADIHAYWAPCVWYIQPCDNTAMGGMRFENIRIQSDGRKLNLIKIKPMVRKGWGWKGTEPGKYVKNIVFKNIRVTGTGNPSDARILIEGAAKNRPVSDIVFENCIIDSKPLRRKHIKTGSFVKDIIVKTSK